MAAPNPFEIIPTLVRQFQPHEPSHHAAMREILAAIVFRLTTHAPLVALVNGEPLRDWLVSRFLALRFEEQIPLADFEAALDWALRENLAANQGLGTLRVGVA